MLNKLKNINYQHLIKQLGDVRLLGLLMFGVVALLVAWSGLNAITDNYKLQQQIAELEQENRVIELSNENMRLKNQYYRTDQYADLVARRQLGLAAPGESVLLVPEDTALSYAPELEASAPPDDLPAETKDLPFYHRNFNAWMDFFFNRNPMD